jgi:succinyl-CoA synthetase beta subunit
MLKSQLRELNWTDTEGNIGILCNDTCLAAATLDLVYRAKGKPTSCLIVDGYASWDMQSLSSPVQQLQSALQQITEADDIDVVLVNILSSPAASEELAEVIANFLLSKVGETAVLSAADRAERPTGVTSRSRRERSNGNHSLYGQSVSVSELPDFVIRIVGGKLDSAKERLAAIPVHWMDNLDEAVAQAISLAKSTKV